MPRRADVTVVIRIERPQFHGRNGSVPAVIHHLGPGAFHLAGYLSIDRQRAIVEQCRALIEGDVPAYVPVVRGGGRMHVRMLCLGRHWNGKTYTYEPTRSDFDGQPVPPLPGGVRRARAGIWPARSDMSVEADLCILNYYDADGRMGLHQDKDESAAVDRGGCAGGLRLARRRGAVPVRRHETARPGRGAAARVRRRRSCSAVLRGCGITASRAFCPAPRRPASRSAAGSI